ncbi:MAG: arsenate reductase [Rickettsiaceae bacterium]|jgi:arsenate reductase|nr:arsenate reductase [Rickettsiaceae bacterium]
MNVTIYHNPRCTKSRETLALLKENGIEPTIVEYLNKPPSVQTLKEIVKALGVKPREIIRTKEDAYKQCGLDDKTLTDNQIIEILVKNPILIERPIVCVGKKAAVGRPPENVLKIL